MDEPRSRHMVSTGWLAARLSAPDIVVVDASWYLPAMNRDPDAEYRAARIPGAIRFDIDTVKDSDTTLPHMLPSPVKFASMARKLGIGDGMKIVVYDGIGLFSAPRVWWTFKTMGARDVAILDGGLPKWLAEGHPIEDGPPRPRQERHFTVRFDHSRVRDMASVARALETGSHQVVDARPAARFSGEVPEPRPGVRSGHMPGALSVPADTLVADGRLRPADEIRAAVAAAGVDPARQIITSCGSGVTAATLLLALDSIGLDRKSLYDGSMAEWGSTADMPLVHGAAKPAASRP